MFLSIKKLISELKMKFIGYNLFGTYLRSSLNSNPNGINIFFIISISNFLSLNLIISLNKNDYKFLPISILILGAIKLIFFNSLNFNLFIL